MKLNPDCIRDILLEIEEITSPHSLFSLRENSENLNAVYGNDTVVYHLHQCNYSGFFTKLTEDMMDNITVIDLSPIGHQFLANIREKTIWNGVKNIATKVGSTSLNALVQISSNVITELIKSQFNLS